MKDLTFSDILFIIFLPYILLGYAILCLLYAPYELIKERLSSA